MSVLVNHNDGEFKKISKFSISAITGHRGHSFIHEKLIFNNMISTFDKNCVSTPQEGGTNTCMNMKQNLLNPHC
jgi:hypothetical protein